MIDPYTAMQVLLGGAAVGALWTGGDLLVRHHRQAVAVIDEALSGEPSRSLWQAMVAHFPAEARALRRRMIRIARGRGSRYERQVRIGNAAAAVRHRLGKAVLSIPDAEIDALLDAQIALYRRFEADPPLAARFVVHGVGALPPYDPEGTIAECARIRTHAYQAMARHHRAPVSGALPVGADYERLKASLARVWGMEDAFDVLDLLDDDDPRLGEAFLTILRTVRHGRFEGAERLRRAWVIALING